MGEKQSNSGHAGLPRGFMANFPSLTFQFPRPDLAMSLFDFAGNGSPASPGAPLPPASPTQSPTPSPFAGRRRRTERTERGEAGSAVDTGKDGKQVPSAAETSVPNRGQAKGSRIGRRALEVARGEIGVREDPPGSNRGPRVDTYQDAQGQPWCAHFVSWCVGQAGDRPFPHTGWVEGLRRWAKRNERYTPVEEARPLSGDIFTMPRHDRNGNLVGGHTGFVQSYDPEAASIQTVEGNTSQSVAERSRALASLDGFIRL